MGQNVPKTKTSWRQLLKNNELLHLEWSDKLADFTIELAAKRDEDSASPQERCMLSILSAAVDRRWSPNEHQYVSFAVAWKRVCTYAGLDISREVGGKGGFTAAQRAFVDAWEQLKAMASIDEG